MTDFCDAKLDEEENEIEQRAKAKLEKILKGMMKNYADVESISINIKRK